MGEKGLMIVPFEQQQILAKSIAESGLWGIKSQAQALVLMALCEAEGLHPATAVQQYHIFNGRASKRADAMLASFQAAGGKIKWTEYNDQRCEAVFSHPAGGEITIDWDMDRSKAAGLGVKDNWKHYPRQMLKARVISEGVRAIYPGCTSGMYTPEEVVDFDNDAIEGELASGNGNTDPEPEPKATYANEIDAAWAALREKALRLGLDWDKAAAHIRKTNEHLLLTPAILRSYLPKLDDWQRAQEAKNRERDRLIAQQEKAKEADHGTSV